MFRMPMGGDDDGIPDPRSLIGSMLLQQLLAGAMEEDDDEEEDDGSLKCPVCNERYEFVAATENRLSHGAMNVFVSSNCPICLEENVTPPMVALSCGHLVCGEDFGRLGGLTEPGARPPSRPPTERSSRRRGRGVPLPPELDGDIMDFLMYMASQAGPDYDEDEDEDDYSDDDDDDDEDMPPLEDLDGRPVANDDDDDEDSNMPPLENVDDDDDSSMPPLEEVAGQSETSSNEEPTDTSLSNLQIQSFSHESAVYVSEMSSSQRPRSSAGGVWIWFPHGDHMDLFFVDESLNTMQLEPTFDLDARPVFHPSGVYVASAPGGPPRFDNKWIVQFATLNRTTSDKYMIPRGAVDSFVSDGHGGLWTITRQGSSKKLSFFNFRNKNGHVKHTLPLTAHIYADHTGGVWAHIRKRGGNMEPGLYHCTTRTAIHRGDIDENAILVSDEKGGIWVVDQHNGQTRLSHYYADEQRPVSSYTFPVSECPFNKDISVVPICGGGLMSSVYLHCKRGDKWKLCVANAVGIANEICDLPRSAKLSGDSAGGCWVFKQTDRSSGRRALFRVDHNHQVGSDGIEFPPHTEVLGW
jgi:hypothetical protein